MVKETEGNRGYKQTEVGVIPNDWDIVPLGRIATITKLAGFEYSKYFNSYKDGGDIIVIRGTNITNNVLDLSDVKTIPSTISKGLQRSKLFMNDLVFAYVGTIGPIYLVEENDKFHLGPNTSKITVDKIIDVQYIYSYFKSSLIRIEIREHTSIGAQPSLSMSKIRNFKIVLPTTKPEQTAIATALNDADALIAELEKLIAKKRAIKQGAMQELLRPKEGWVEKVLGKTAILKARIGWQGLTTAEYRPNGDYYLITGTEFKEGFIDWESCFYVDEDRYKQDKNIQIKENDVLVTKDGTIGKVAFIKALSKPATLNSGVFVIRPVDHAFLPEFFYYVLLSDYFKIFLSQLSAGSTINHLYQKDFISFKFFIPKKTEEQKEIAVTLSDIDAEIEGLEKKLDKYKMIKQGMMQVLLTGKIRLINN